MYSYVIRSLLNKVPGSMQFALEMVREAIIPRVGVTCLATPLKFGVNTRLLYAFVFELAVVATRLESNDLVCLAHDFVSRGVL